MNPDGTTAIQVSPVQENDEMRPVREVFDRAISAMIASTELAKEVASIRSEVSEIKLDLDKARARNAELDQLLNDTREQRNRWRDSAEKLEQSLATIEAALRQANQDKADLQTANESLRRDLEATIKDRNDYAQLSDDYHHSLTTAESKLLELKNHVQAVFGLYEPLPPPATPVPTATVEPIPAAAEPKPEPTGLPDEAYKSYYDSPRF